MSNKGQQTSRINWTIEALKCAIEVFGDEETAREWMSTKIPELENRAPLELLNSKKGFQKVVDTLGRISFGAPA